MADKKISALGAVSSATAADVFPVVQDGVTKKESVDQLNTFLASSTQTLTNKTFDANGTGNSLSNVDVADLANGTDGQLITWGADAAPTTVPTGDAGQLLTSNGAGAAPTFQAAEKVVEIMLADNSTTVTSGDGIGSIYYTVPDAFNGMNLVDADATVMTAGAGATSSTTIMIYNLTQTADMLTGAITIEDTLTSSYTSTTPAVIDTNNDDVATGDQLRFDVDSVTTTAPTGLSAILTFQKP